MLLSIWCWLSFLIGLYYSIKKGYHLVIICISYLRPMISSSDLHKKFGSDSYVLITGCTAGIGLAYARFFAKNKFNLILWSRTQSKLDDLKLSLQKEFPGLKIVTIATDFVHCTEPNFFKNAFDQIKHLDVSIVVNNVGYIKRNKSFDLFTAEELVTSINVNTIPHAAISGFFLNQFKTRDRSLSSAFIDLGSIVSELPSMGRFIYSATKNFNYYFTSAISNANLRIPNLMCQAVLPGLVNTSMADSFFKGYKKKTLKGEVTKWTLVQPDDTVNGSIRGLANGVMVVGGAFIHSVMGIIYYSMSELTWFMFDVKAAFRSLRA